MTPALAWLVLAAAAQKPALVSVHAHTLEGRTAVAVVTTTAPVRVGLERAGTEVVLTLDARLPKDLGPIAVIPPLRAIQVENAARSVVVRVHVDPNVAYEVRRQGTLLTVLFGEVAKPEVPAVGAGADVQELYRGLLPAPGNDTSAASEERTPGQERDFTAAENEGLQVGRLTLRPTLAALYVDAEGALLETPSPVSDRYYELRPQVAGQLPLGTGHLRADYEARLRRGSSYALVDGVTTHIVNANLDAPVGPHVVARAAGHFATGVLETTEVDPGREYFFQLGRYTRYDASGGLRVETGSRLGVDLSGRRYRLDLDESAGFFDYEGWTALAALSIELRPRARALVGYAYDEIPAPARRTEAAMKGHSGWLSLQGEILPLVTGFATVGYRDQRNPNAGPGGRRYRGLSASASLLKEFSRATTLEIRASRTTPPSAFESNGFFVATSFHGELKAALPFSFVALAGLGYHRNDYLVDTPEIAGPRTDRITGWLGGIGRSITDWAFARVDYRYERRDSNLEQFDTDAHALTAQLGVRLYRARAQP